MIYASFVITIMLSIYAGWLAFRYNMHMFQLNTYINGEQRIWIRKNIRLQWILLFAIILGIIRIFLAAGKTFNDVYDVALCITDIIIWLTLYVIITVYKLRREMNTKKKLVFTSRVKRMLATITIISFMLIIIVIISGLINLLPGIFVILVGSQLFMNMLSNIINKPIETGVKNYYINDAKKILKSMPNLTVIGVTGSYGKTSVKFYLETLLKHKYNVIVTPESYNTPMGIVKTIRGQMKPSHEIFVCEMGARYVGEIKELCDIVNPDMGVITAVGPQHLETFGSIDNIKKTKFELADCLPSGGVIFLNGDNTYIQEKAVDYNNKVFYYSHDDGEKNEGYYASDIAVSPLGTEFTVTAPDGCKESFQMKLIGAHNVINVVGAIAVVNSMGISLSDLRVPVRRIRPVAHRMEIKDRGNVTIIDDAFNSNPVGSKAAVETLSMFDGTRILITPGMIELGDDEFEYNRKLGNYAADCCDYILLVGKKHTEPILKGVLEKGFSDEKCHVFDKLEEAISYAYSLKTDKHKYILLENDLPDNY